MADNAAPASDDIGGVLYQRIKLAAGPDGTWNADLDARDLPGTLGGALYVDNTQKVVRIAQTPTISTTAYSSGDAVGGLLTFANAARASGMPFVVQSAVITDLSKQNAPLSLVLFDRTFTATADNAAFAPSTADLANLVGIIEVVAADYSSFSANSAASWPQTTNHSGLYVLPNGTDLFGQLVAYGTPTYATTSALTVDLIIRQL